MSISCTTNIWGNNRAWLPPNFCASIYIDGLQKPRGLHIDSDHDEILLVKRGNSRVIRLDDDEKTVVTVASMSGLNHGIELAGRYLYASSSTTVYWWPYQSGQIMTANDIDSDRQEVIVGMGETTISSELGAPGGHKTRTLAFDDEGYLYVSIGSNGNVDADSFRSRIRRFDISAWDDATQPYIYITKRRLRNEVGMAFDSYGDLWSVENGADNLYRDDLGGDIHDDNPSEELNRFRQDQVGESWGYPFCWSEYCLPLGVGGSGMKGANSIWSWPTFMSAGYTDLWCRENTNPAELSMPAHSAPLGITFYNWKASSQSCKGAFPKAMDKYAFIAFHGSWNRDPSTGFKVVYVPFDDAGNPTSLPIDLFCHDGDTAKWPSSLRPVDLQFDQCSRLFVTEDGTGSVIKIEYLGGDDEFVQIETDVADGASCSPFQSESLSPSHTPIRLPTRLPSSPPTPEPSTLALPAPESTDFLVTVTSSPITSDPTVSPSNSSETSSPTDAPSLNTVTFSPTTSDPTVSPSKSAVTSSPTTSDPTGTPSRSRETSSPSKSASLSPISEPTVTPSKSPVTNGYYSHGDDSNIYNYSNDNSAACGPNSTFLMIMFVALAHYLSLQ